MPVSPPHVEIVSFPGANRIAVTTSWDDGVVEDRRVVAAFNQWGLKGTFNLNSGTLGRTGKPTPADAKAHLDASEVASLFAGHEVAIHTVTHPSLKLLDQSNIVREVVEDRAALEDLVGYPVRGMAYPYGSYDQRTIEILRGLGLAYARIVQDVESCFPPAEPLAWQANMHMFGRIQRGDQWLDVPGRFNELYNIGWYSGVFFVWGHSYEFGHHYEGGPAWDDWASLERLFKPLSGRPDVWYCTNIELFDYEAARQRLAVAANRKTAYNPSAIPVTVRIAGKLIEIPPGKVTSLVA